MDWTQFGLAGGMIGCIFAGIGWAGQRLLGKGGIMEKYAEAMQAVSASLDGVMRVVDKHSGESAEHSDACAKTGERVDAIHRAAVAALCEIEDECRSRGVDIAARVDRIRQVLDG